MKSDFREAFLKLCEKHAVSAWAVFVDARPTRDDDIPGARYILDWGTAMVIDSDIPLDASPHVVHVIARVMGEHAAKFTTKLSELGPQEMKVLKEQRDSEPGAYGQ